MRIAFLNPVGEIGGAERVLLEVLSSLKAARPDWEMLVVLGSDGPLRAALAITGARVRVLPYPSLFARLGDWAAAGPAWHAAGNLALAGNIAISAIPLALYARRLRRALREFRPDLIHTNGFKMHILGMWGCPRRTPIVWHVHDYVRMRPLMSRLLRMYARRCGAAVANSSSVAEDLRAVTAGRVRVYPVLNAVDLEKFSPAGSSLDLDALSGLKLAPPETVRVGLVATMARWKGHEVFLNAISKLPAELPIRAYVVGGPIYTTQGSQYALDELRSIAAALGIADRVGFTGQVDDSAAAMRSLDVVVHASTKPEPFGLVIAEAMACGRAVVASWGAGAQEIHGGEAMLLGHPPGSADELAACIERLVADDELRAGYGARGRLAAEEWFHKSRIASQLISIYQDTVDASPSP